MFIPDGYAQINLMFTWPESNQTAEIVYGVALDDVGLTPVSTANAALNAYNDAGMDQMTTDALVLSTVHAKWGPNDTGGAGDVTANVPGTLSGNSVTPNVAMLVSKNTLHGGRHGRGRLYWPGIQEGVVDDYGNLDSGALDTFQSHFDDWVTAHVGFDIPIYLLHAEDSPTPFAVDSMTVKSLVATQRRRLGR